jgi:hypothetical protein
MTTERIPLQAKRIGLFSCRGLDESRQIDQESRVRLNSVTFIERSFHNPRLRYGRHANKLEPKRRHSSALIASHSSQ